MKIQINKENTEAEKLIPPSAPDGSRIGVNYVDAYIKALNVSLEDGRKVTCKRKGLKILLSVGDKQADVLLNRLENGPDVKNILKAALEKVSTQVGVRFVTDQQTMYFES
jgi:hypothetical protein